jgi:nicotinamide-nucleotide amidase
MRAEILTIGDEILRGEIVDSNKTFLSERLLHHDVECRFQTSVADDPADMVDAFRRAVSRADVVLVSGGLGPTRDDLTVEVLARTFGRGLVLDEASLETIREFFRRVGRDMAENNAKQAWFPRDAEVLANPIGTAPGCALPLGPDETGAGEAIVFCMPGVPRELYRMMDEQVLPRIARWRAGRGQAEAGRSPVVVRAAVIRTFGVGESSLDAELKDIARIEGVQLGFRTSFPDNALRPLARAATAEEAEAKVRALTREIRLRLGSIVYSETDETLEVVLGRLLAERGKTIAVAESCTGGLMAEKLTRVPGSSAYFLGGVVAYSDAAKTELLGVPAALIAAHGAVSNEVAVAMAEGARERFGADYGVSTTGISGPDGGSAEKPVGLVSVAIAWQQGARVESHADSFVFALDRERHRALSVQVGLDWVRRSLLGFELTSPSLLRQRDSGRQAPRQPGGAAASNDTNRQQAGHTSSTHPIESSTQEGRRK